MGEEGKGREEGRGEEGRKEGNRKLTSSTNEGKRG